jgi:hypothetical protein
VPKDFKFILRLKPNIELKLRQNANSKLNRAMRVVKMSGRVRVMNSGVGSGPGWVIEF